VPTIVEGVSKFINQRFGNYVKVIDTCTNYNHARESIERNLSDLHFIISDIDLESAFTGIDLVKSFSIRSFKVIFYSDYRDEFEIKTVDMPEAMFIDKKTGANKFDMLEYAVRKIIREVNPGSHTNGVIPTNRTHPSSIYVLTKPDRSKLRYDKNEILFVCSDIYFLEELVKKGIAKDTYVMEGGYTRQAVKEMFWLFSKYETVGQSIKAPNLSELEEIDGFTRIHIGCVMQLGTEKRIAVSGKGSEFEAIVEFANGLKIKANNRASRELWNDLV
jgi:hypothetical protein